jgi:glycyl-tRNA synthetase beta chain
VNAVLASGCGTLSDVEARLTALAAVRPTEDFEPLAASFKRIQNILKQAAFEPSNVMDQSLARRWTRTRAPCRFRSRPPRPRKSKPILRPWSRLLRCAPALTHFFDKVLVNAKDERVRNNRLTLLHNLLTEFSTIADFSEIVTSGDHK